MKDSSRVLNFWRVAGVVSVLLLVLAWPGCGETFRPVATPLIPPQVSPGASHFVVALSENGAICTASTVCNPGASTRIDVSGDSNAGVATMGVGPVHAALLPNATRIYVANSLEGSISSIAPDSTSPVTTTSLPRATVTITDASQSGSNTIYTYTLISGLPLGVGMTIAITNMTDSGNNGTFMITALPATGMFTVVNPSGVIASSQSGSGIASSTPVFVATTENATIYVANYGGDTVSAISTTNNSLINPPIAVGVNPVALAETPDARKLYAVDKGDNTVTSIDTVTRTVTKIITDPSFMTPVWAVARPDSARVYVLNSGSGTVSDINSSNVNVTVGGQLFAPDSVIASSPVGAGANFMVYDNTKSRLYVVNPTSTNVIVLDATADPPSPISTISLATAPSGSVALCATAPCVPTSITVLPDGTRFYVGTYALVNDTSQNPSVPAIEFQVTVVDTQSNAVRTLVPLNPSSTLFDLPFSASPNPTGCGSSPFGASPLPFRLSVMASADSSRVYVANCDSGNIEIIATSNETLISGLDGVSALNIPAPTGILQDPKTGNFLPQNPVFMLAGP